MVIAVSWGAMESPSYNARTVNADQSWPHRLRMAMASSTPPIQPAVLQKTCINTRGRYPILAQNIPGAHEILVGIVAAADQVLREVEGLWIQARAGALRSCGYSGARSAGHRQPLRAGRMLVARQFADDVEAMSPPSPPSWEWCQEVRQTANIGTCASCMV